MGIGMLIGGVLAFVIAATKVVLPYDESFLGMTRDALPAINPRLLDFMAHDRMTLAGVMIATGVLYIGLSLFGIRRGLHWAKQAVLISAFTGFVILSFPRVRLSRSVSCICHRSVTSVAAVWRSCAARYVHANRASRDARQFCVANESLGTVTAHRSRIRIARGRRSDFSDRGNAGVRTCRSGVHANYRRHVIVSRSAGRSAGSARSRDARRECCWPPDGCFCCPRCGDFGVVRRGCGGLR